MAAKDFIVKNFLILGLLTVLTFGVVFPGPGTWTDQQSIAGQSLGDIAIDLIFIVSGVCLDNAKDALKWKALSLGMVLVLCVTPCLAIPILYLKKINESLNYSLLQGMALFCVVPTTLSSGVTMITQAKGNVSLAILLTSVTNLIGVFTMSMTTPSIFSLTTVSISKVGMLRELLLLTLLPLVIGMCLRRFVTPLREFATKYKKPLGLTQNSCILFVAWMNVSKAQPDIIAAQSSDLIVCLTLAISVHLIYRVIGYVVATGTKLDPPEWVTIVLMCSQKSLPVCVSVMAALPPGLRSQSGLFMIPCIMAHASQLIIDSILAVRWEVQADGAFKIESKKPLLST